MKRRACLSVLGGALAFPFVIHTSAAAQSTATATSVTATALTAAGWKIYGSFNFPYMGIFPSDWEVTSVPGQYGRNDLFTSTADNLSQVLTEMIVYASPITEKASSERDRENRLGTLVEERFNSLSQIELRMRPIGPRLYSSNFYNLPNKENTLAAYITTDIAPQAIPNRPITFYSVMFEQGGYTWFFDANLDSANKETDVDNMNKMAAVLDVTTPRDAG